MSAKRPKTPKGTMQEIIRDVWGLVSIFSVYGPNTDVERRKNFIQNRRERGQPPQGRQDVETAWNKWFGHLPLQEWEPNAGALLLQVWNICLTFREERKFDGDLVYKVLVNAKWIVASGVEEIEPACRLLEGIQRGHYGRRSVEAGWKAGFPDYMKTPEGVEMEARMIVADWLNVEEDRDAQTTIQAQAHQFVRKNAVIYNYNHEVVRLACEVIELVRYGSGKGAMKYFQLGTLDSRDRKVKRPKSTLMGKNSIL
ncbi:hypothetical protein C8R46DRAFT_1040464 [Mycena filopes]|nr:hypothetical protein C8R46DRAFT_1040464 [Mycena filopes]